VRGSYYDVLGVPPTADETEIRARYLLLMRRHHPDVNQSPTAHARAAEIAEAFRALSDAALRSRHDAELAQQRQDAVSARAILLYRGRKSLSPGRKRHLRLLGRWPGRLALGILLAATLLVGQQLDLRLTAGAAALSAAPIRDDMNKETREAIAALNAASSREAHAMPPVSRDTVAAGAAAFRRLAVGGKPVEARPYSETCHAEAANSGSWEELDFCVAFDQAAFLADDKKPSAASAHYFVDRHDRAAHLYLSRISSLDAISLRLRRIRDQLAPRRDDRFQARAAYVLNQITKRGWRLADAAQEALHPGRTEHLERIGKPRDF
jgi:hypothetical protein